MEPGTWRALFTLLMFLAFIGICLWAWSAQRKQDFNEAANLPLEDDDALLADQQRSTKPTVRSH
jgi:cytochrome c oxidase cbb3-type subunit 4